VRIYERREFIYDRAFGPHDFPVTDSISVSVLDMQLSRLQVSILVRARVEIAPLAPHRVTFSPAETEMHSSESLKFDTVR
jgi:hypothetical protein